MAHRRRPRAGTLGWVHWHNATRLHSHCNDVPPAEFEAAFYAAQHPDQLNWGQTR